MTSRSRAGHNVSGEARAPAAPLGRLRPTGGRRLGDHVARGWPRWAAPPARPARASTGVR